MIKVSEMEVQRYAATMTAIDTAKVCDESKTFAKNIVDSMFGVSSPEPALQVGDIVRCHNSSIVGGASKAMGKEGIIVGCTGKEVLGFTDHWIVEFFEAIPQAHHCLDRVPSGQGFWMPNEALTLVWRPTLKAQVGDIT